MEKHPEMGKNGRDGLWPSIEQKRWVIDFFIVLVIVLLALAYWYRQQLKVRHLAAQESVANATIDDLRRHLGNLNEELGKIAPAQQPTAVLANKIAGGQPTKFFGVGSSKFPPPKNAQSAAGRLRNEEKSILAGVDNLGLRGCS